MSKSGREPLRPPPVWTDEQLRAELARATAVFREERMREPLEAYLDQFEDYRDAFDELLEETVDLTLLAEKAVEVLTNPKWLEAVRYLAGPPISLDDLKTLAGASVAIKRLKADPALARRIIETVLLGLDRQRFPWLAPGEVRAATETERASAVLASAALIASQRVATMRRNEGKTAQEEKVKAALVGAGFNAVAPRTARTLDEAPGLGEFCGESVLGTRKADLLVRLWDHRVMPVECKVSNSSTNSIKRLNNDAAVKAHGWRTDFGSVGVVPVAVLSGVYKLRNLLDAQARGLTIFWAHDLAAMLTWIGTTKGGAIAATGPVSAVSMVAERPSPPPVAEGSGDGERTSEAKRKKRTRKTE